MPQSSAAPRRSDAFGPRLRPRRATRHGESRTCASSRTTHEAGPQHLHRSRSPLPRPAGALLLAPPQRNLLRETLRLLPDLLRLRRELAGDSDVPRAVRMGLWLLLGYLAIPIDLVPDFVPVLGYADDAIIVAVGLRSVVRRAGVPIIHRHWPGTDDGLAALARLTGMQLNHTQTHAHADLALANALVGRYLDHAFCHCVFDPLHSLAGWHVGGHTQDCVPGRRDVAVAVEAEVAEEPVALLDRGLQLRSTDARVPSERAIAASTASVAWAVWSTKLRRWSAPGRSRVRSARRRR